MATLELPLQVQGVSRRLACWAQGAECCVGRLRFAASNGWRSSLSLSCKEPRNRSFGAPCCTSVDVESESADSEVSSASESADSEVSSADALRAAEKFVVVNTGKWECRSCGYTYDQSKGEPSYPISSGTEFRQLPEDWRCPTCGAGKSYFNSKSVEIAGFAENQKFGLGTNSLTSGQKSLLIYGSLLLFFCLFLSGYFLQ